MRPLFKLCRVFFNNIADLNELSVYCIILDVTSIKKNLIELNILYINQFLSHFHDDNAAKSILYTKMKCPNINQRYLLTSFNAKSEFFLKSQAKQS